MVPPWLWPWVRALQKPRGQASPGPPLCQAQCLEHSWCLTVVVELAGLPGTFPTAGHGCRQGIHTGLGRIVATDSCTGLLATHTACC